MDSMHQRLIPLIFQTSQVNFFYVLVGSIPKSRCGVTGSHILGLMLHIEKKAFDYHLSLVGHSTNSPANSLSALVKLNSPNTYDDIYANYHLLVYLWRNLSFNSTRFFFNCIFMLGSLCENSFKKSYE